MRLATPEEKASNERALVRLLRAFPRLPKRQVGDFLMSTTAFPFNSLLEAVDQAEELSRRVGKSVNRAYLQASKDMDASMRHYSRAQPKKEFASEEDLQSLRRAE